MKKNRIVAAIAALAVAPMLMVAPVSMAAIPGGVVVMQGGEEEASTSGGPTDPGHGPTEVIPEKTATLPVQHVDTTKNGKSEIRVVKYKKTVQNGAKAPTGHEMTVDGEKVQGVVFKVRQIASIGGTNLPDAAALATNAGYKALAGLVNDQGKPKGDVAYVDGKDKTATTNQQGEADFADLSFGLYEVSEVSAPAGYTKAETFYVALPFVDHSTEATEGGTGWNYAPVFYPKNRLDTLEKTVDDHATTGIGSPIVYTLKGSVSSAEPGEYVITDQLSKKVKLKSVEVKLDKAGTDVALTADDDYTLDGTADGVGQKVVVTLKDAGLAKLKTAYDENAETKVVVTINGVIASIAGADNDNVAVPNKAFLVPNNSTQWDTPLPGETISGLVSSEVATKFGGIKIHKVAQSDNSVNLAGAKFKVYASKADAEAQTKGTELTFLDKDGNEVTEVATGDNGLAVIEGLRVSNFINGKATNDTDTETNNDSVKYWVVETVAPAGYSVLPEPIEVSVASADANNDQKIDLTEKQVEDVKVNAGFYLPKTGLGGPFGFVLAGGVLLAAGGVAIVVARRGRKQEA